MRPRLTEPESSVQEEWDWLLFLAACWAVELRREFREARLFKLSASNCAAADLVRTDLEEVSPDPRGVSSGLAA